MTVRNYWYGSALLFGLSGALTAPGEAQAPSASAAAPALSTQTVERVADLLRFWNYVRLFQVDEIRVMGPEWEAALEAAAAPAFAAADDAQLAKVAAAMLAKIQPETPPVQGPQAAADSTTPAIRLASNRVVVSCPGLADAIVNQEDLQWSPAVTASLKQHGVIFDCRGFGTGFQGYRQAETFYNWLGDNVPRMLFRPMAGGAIRKRMHDGYPPEVGNTSGGYISGTVDRSLRGFKASGKRTVPMVFVADSSTPKLWELIGPLHGGGGAKLVLQGAMADPGLSPFAAKHLTLPVRTAEFVAADGRVGLRPDACLAADSGSAALATARTLLAGRKGPGCRTQPALAPTAPVLAADDGSAALTLGKRMVALAKLWGTFEYFFPYKHLADQPWTVALEEFVPVFAAAETQSAYSDAVMRLAARSQDTHTGVTGTLPSRVAGAYAPAIYVRPVQAGFAVAGLHQPDVADRVRPGDQIVAVDGKPVERIADELKEVFAASTNQSFAARVARVLMAGPSGSDVRLTIRRGDAPATDVQVKRSMLFGLAGRRPATSAPSFSRLAVGDIGYVDLERLTGEDADKAIDALMDTKAIIFDLRGYPQGTAWALAPRLALDGREGAIAAQFRRPVYQGPRDPQENWTSFSQRIPTGDKPRYRGRVIVLIDDRAISQSEHTALFFEAANDPVFVGTPTTGANGDVTTLVLPGGLEVRFTGHDVRHADGRQLQRVGIRPDIVVAPTFAGLSSGRDEVLEAGIEAARRP